MQPKPRSSAPTQQLHAPSADANLRAAADGSARHEPTHDEVRQRAYEIYRARGAKPGSAADDWAQAERDLRRGRK